jgi:hypothetical protein
MIDYRGLKVLLMAGVASRRQTDELSCSGIRVAVIALQQGMRPYQRKPILVIADLLQRDLPTLDRMAAFAVRSELAAVNIRVAVGASGTDILENQTDMAFCATHLFMHSPQWIARVIVVELGIGSDGLPTGERMTIPAWCRYRTVWIGDLRPGSTHSSLLAIRGLLPSHAD